MQQKERKLIVSDSAEIFEDGKTKVCEIKIYDNHINITSKGTVFVMEYADISKLIINKRYDKIRKLLISSTVLLTNFSVYDESSPDIVLSEYKFEKLVKSVDEEKSRIQSLERFKDEYIKNHKFISDFFVKATVDMNVLQDNHVNSKINSSIFLFLAKDMFRSIEKTESLSVVDMKLLNGNYFKKLFDDTVNYSLYTGDFEIPKDRILEYCDSLIKNTKLHEIYIYNQLSNDEERWLSQSDDLFEVEYFFKDHTAFRYMFIAAISFIRIIVLARNKHRFVRNKDLYQMYLNLTKDSNLDIEYITDKLYPIYTEFYSDTFSDELSMLDFYSFLHSIKNESRGLDVIETLGIEGINEVKNRIRIILDEEGVNANKEIFDEILSFLMSIDISSVLDNQFDGENIKSSFILTYNYLIPNLCENVPAQVFDMFIDYNYWSNIELLCNSFMKKNLNKEKDRLLKGDMSFENRMIEDKYSFENIQSGYDFEDYLEALFIKMGYIVTTTKKSSDQGGDLVLRKDGETIVVQAKYYSSPVGNKAVQEVVASMPYYSADKGVVVTNNRFTNSAVDLATANGISLVDGDNLGRIRDAILNNANPIFVD